MRYFKGFNSGSTEIIQDRQESSTIDTEPITRSTAEKTIFAEKHGSSDNITDICFFMHSSSVRLEKPAVLQECVLKSESWQGTVLAVEEKALILDVRNDQKPQKRLRLRVNKEIVEGDINRIDRRTSVRIDYQRIRNYQDVIENKLSVRLREPAEIPTDILEKEFQARIKRFSYMLDKEIINED